MEWEALKVWLEELKSPPPLDNGAPLNLHSNVQTSKAFPRISPALTLNSEEMLKKQQRPSHVCVRQRKKKTFIFAVFLYFFLG